MNLCGIVPQFLIGDLEGSVDITCVPQKEIFTTGTLHSHVIPALSLQQL